MITAHLLPTRLVILRFPGSGWWSFPRSAKKLLRRSGVSGHATGAGVAGGVLDYIAEPLLKIICLTVIQTNIEHHFNQTFIPAAKQQQTITTNE